MHNEPEQIAKDPDAKGKAKSKPLIFRPGDQVILPAYGSGYGTRRKKGLRIHGTVTQVEEERVQVNTAGYLLWIPLKKLERI